MGNRKNSLSGRDTSVRSVTYPPGSEREFLQCQCLPLNICPEEDGADDHKDDVRDVVPVALHDARASSFETNILVSFKGAAERAGDGG